MLQLLSKQNALQFTKIIIQNIRSGPQRNRFNNNEWISKGELGTKFQDFLVNGSIQLGKSILTINCGELLNEVQDFYDLYPQTNEWIESTELKIKQALKQNKQNKQTNKKVG